MLRPIFGAMVVFPCIASCGLSQEPLKLDVKPDLEAITLNRTLKLVSVDVPKPPLLVKANSTPNAFNTHPFGGLIQTQLRFIQSKTWDARSALYTKESLPILEKQGAKQAFETRDTGMLTETGIVFFSFIKLIDEKGEILAAQAPIGAADVKEGDKRWEILVERLGMETGRPFKFGPKIVRKVEGIWQVDAELESSGLATLIAFTDPSHLKGVLERKLGVAK